MKANPGFFLGTSSGWARGAGFVVFGVWGRGPAGFCWLFLAKKPNAGLDCEGGSPVGAWGSAWAGVCGVLLRNFGLLLLIRGLLWLGGGWGLVGARICGLWRRI